MLRQTFTSKPLTYRLASDMHTGLGPYNAYYPYLTTPPRVYGEEYDGSGVVAMFVNDEDSLGFEAIYLLLQHNQVDWPSYLFRLHRWDATDGTYLGGVDSSIGPGANLFSQCRDGTLYSMDEHNQVYKYSVDTTTHKLVTDGVLQFYFDSSVYSTFIAPTGYLIDNELGLLLGNGNLHNYLAVWDLATGEIRSRIPTPGYPVVVMPEDTARCYVMTSCGVITLIDYSENKVLSAFRLQAGFQTEPAGQGRSICWDRRYRRFLNWLYTPVDETGQNTAVIGGYFPVPIPTYLTAPIPLKPPRKYRTTPILTRVCGNMGEPVGGTRVSFSLPAGTTAAIANGFPSNSDGDGDALGSIIDLDSGVITLNATATV